MLVPIFLILTIAGSSYVGWVNQLHEGLPLTSQLVTDKDQYQVGENIEATLLYVNPYPFSVKFTPPSCVSTVMSKWFDSISVVNYAPWQIVGWEETVWRNAPWVVLGAYEQFKVVSVTFTAVNEGSYIIVVAGVSKIIQIKN